MLQTSNTVFLPPKQIVFIDESWDVKAPPCDTIDKLIHSLMSFGNLVAIGKMGPSAYQEEAFPLKGEIAGRKIYGWAQGTKKPHCPPVEVILLGAKKTKTNSYVFYTLAADITNNEKSLIRGFTAYPTDKRVYVMSYENFLKKSLSNLHPVVPNADFLYLVDAMSILKDSETKEKCRKVGQEIFNHYKSQKNSDVAKEALQRICTAAYFLGNENLIRKRHIEAAWNGIGDENWRWQK
jgi:hypothetical protein